MKEVQSGNMRTFCVLICSFSLVCGAQGGKEKQAKTSEHGASRSEHPAGGSAHNVQQARAPQHVASPGHPVGVPSGGNPASRLTEPESHPETAPAGNAAAKPAAPAPPAPVYHYNFPTKSGLIGRDFTRPLTPEEQSANAREIEKGQPKGTQAAHGGYPSDTGVYHYNFPTKSGLIGRDFTRPLTPEEQSSIARQSANGQPEGTRAAPGGYQYDNGVYHYNFPTRSGLSGLDFTRPLTPQERSAIARQIASGQPVGAPAPALALAPAQAKVNPSGPQQHFNLPSKPDPAIVGVKFQGTGHIPQSETWTDPKYAAFRNYHHQWHNGEWWRHHCSRIVLIAGGWYFWRSGYWYPAWGYDSLNSYYPYDGPIYAYNGLKPDEVIANVQAALQSLGYYHGPINGFLDSATGVAIASYQQDHGLYSTSAIDEPTLASLGMA